VRGCPASVEQPGLGEHEGAGAYRADSAHPRCCRAQPAGQRAVLRGRTGAVAADDDQHVYRHRRLGEAAIHEHSEPLPAVDAAGATSDHLGPIRRMIGSAQPLHDTIGVVKDRQGPGEIQHLKGWEDHESGGGPAPVGRPADGDVGGVPWADCGAAGVWQQ
jgi:hypothetical protein